MTIHLFVEFIGWTALGMYALSILIWFVAVLFAWRDR